MWHSDPKRIHRLVLTRWITKWTRNVTNWLHLRLSYGLSPYLRLHTILIKVGIPVTFQFSRRDNTMHIITITNDKFSPATGRSNSTICHLLSVKDRLILMKQWDSTTLCMPSNTPNATIQTNSERRHENCNEIWGKIIPALLQTFADCIYLRKSEDVRSFNKEEKGHACYK